METNENEAAKQYDRSPDISPEERLKHDRKAEKVNYRIALNELAFYRDHSTLQAHPGIEAKKGHTWADHQGRVWVAENRISSPARQELEIVLEVIRDYEGKYGEVSREEEALDDIASIRSANRELSNDRLAYFEAQAPEPDPANAANDLARVPELEAGVER